MAKKNSIIAAAFADNIITITVTDAGEISLPLASLTDELKTRAMVHGLIQKISDAAAIAKSELPADPIAAAKVKFSAMSAVAERLREGDWSKRSGEGSGPVAGIIYRAFAEWLADVQKSSKKPPLSDDETRAKYVAAVERCGSHKAVGNLAPVAVIVERLKSERGPVATVDTDSLLADLGL